MKKIVAMSDNIEYIIDLRKIRIDIETAAILAAYHKVVYLLEEANDIDIYAEVIKSNDVTFFCIGQTSINDIISVLEFKFDLSSTYIASINIDAFIPIQNCKTHNYISSFRNSNDNNVFNINKLSKNTEGINELFTDQCMIVFLKNLITAMDNVSHQELTIFCGSSGLTDADIHTSRNDTYKSAISFKELSSLINYYEHAISNITIPKSLNDIVTKRKNELDNLLNSLYSSNGDFVSYSGYPVIFKYLSAYLFLSAQYKSHIEMFNSAFLFAFRSLDWLCDGLLIMSGDAVISSKGNKQDELFLMTNGNLTKPMGFGKKWEKIKSNPLLINLDQNDIDALDNYIAIRNRHVMTHGSVRINSGYYRDFSNMLLTLYNKIDVMINSNSFTFSRTLSLIDNVFKVKYSDLIFDSICEEFNFRLKVL
jgi:hypothetical protein